jgi:hypothetical protein
VSTSAIVPVGASPAPATQAVFLANTYGTPPVSPASPVAAAAPLVAARPAVTPVAPVDAVRGSLIDVYA